MKNIWILTEEMPKSNVMQKILKETASDFGFKISINKLQYDHFEKS